MKIGDYLKEKRVNRKLSQKEFADLIGVSYQTYTKIERNVRNVSYKVRVKISKLFGITLDELEQMS